MTDLTYSAPALEKGMEIMELLAGSDAALPPASIAAALDRSKAEIYRMLITLEQRGYITKADGNRYAITDRLFDLGMRHPPRLDLIEAALPHMRRLTHETGQSCHLTVLSGEAVTVVARVQSPANAGFSVRVGYSVSAAHATSGRVIHAFQSRARQAEELMTLRRVLDRDSLRRFRHDAAEARLAGHLVRNSYYTRGIVDLVVPIFQGQTTTAVAALIVPYLTHFHNDVSREQTLERLALTASAISRDVY